MKKSEILNALIFESESAIKLTVYDDDLLLTLEGTFYPIQAMRLIKKLPAKFSYTYTHLE